MDEEFCWWAHLHRTGTVLSIMIESTDTGHSLDIHASESLSILSLIPIGWVRRGFTMLHWVIIGRSETDCTEVSWDRLARFLQFLAKERRDHLFLIPNSLATVEASFCRSRELGRPSSAGARTGSICKWRILLWCWREKSVVSYFGRGCSCDTRVKRSMLIENGIAVPSDWFNTRVWKETSSNSSHSHHCGTSALLCSTLHPLRPDLTAFDKQRHFVGKNESLQVSFWWVLFISKETFNEKLKKRRTTMRCIDSFSICASQAKWNDNSTIECSNGSKLHRSTGRDLLWRTSSQCNGLAVSQKSSILISTRLTCSYQSMFVFSRWDL